VKIKLDRTICDGFGNCAAHAPGVFSLDEWGYASLERGLSAEVDLAGTGAASQAGAA
jgi:ferredoxin